MKTRIRLTRQGRRNLPYYRIVVSSITSPRDGKFLDILGRYDPKQGIEKATVDLDKIEKWIKCGAQPTDIVKSIIKSVGSNQMKQDKRVA